MRIDLGLSMPRLVERLRLGVTDGSVERWEKNLNRIGEPRRTPITCTRQEPVNEPTTKAHMVAVGTGSDPGNYDRLWSLAEVLTAMDQGRTFYAQGEIPGNIAGVEKYLCPSCTRMHIRSSPDAAAGNNLDNIRRCLSR
ncbi:MAG: hypothetical protein FJ387_28760 [Verrucomicrobia bacterium]|nr:hypothetical protein [Verrucomicrobiota bacterium]